MYAILFITMSIIPQMQEDDYVDLIEINHFYDEDNGRWIFDQIVFYDWSIEDGRFQCVSFRLLKDPAQIPIKCWKRKEYVATWYDGDHIRVVRAKQKIETWTMEDPEVTEREFLPKEKRKGLNLILFWRKDEDRKEHSILIK
jgi:hypothetical protein